MNNFTNVTEIPGQGATKDQLSMMITRYNLAKRYSKNKNILEIGCGSGTGLGYIGKVAKNVVGGDIDKNLVSIASKNYKNYKNIKIQYMDAESLPFKDNSFDLLLLYEAIYYIKNINNFINESLRVIKPGGKIIISSVNCQWHGFNPSPFSFKYYSVDELILLYNKEIKNKVLVGFEDLPKGNNYIKSFIRRLAVSLNLIPKTMKSKEFFKELFYGKLIPIPKIIFDDVAKIEKLLFYNKKKQNINNFKVLFLILDL